ncbi:hypothetical protein [Salinicoccus halodurans]|uniref:Cxxc_20_cxxc protein n=1 Tax=Salinicoccus halodurans TaxID=407035 RepID=A0A0F7HHX2_9STAP|nr:hypothetical protein [Salinicoccus halodurans]AKG72853.1 hypothetical protein AAT16_00620 [Salinicoccus halodurans]SFK75132.1 cxxc_20_cxxc protein [Salinicoccus halodurans]
MAKCTNCGSEWTFKDKMKKSAAFSQAMSCPYCGADQFFSEIQKEKRLDYFYNDSGLLYSNFF